MAQRSDPQRVPRLLPAGASSAPLGNFRGRPLSYFCAENESNGNASKQASGRYSDRPGTVRLLAKPIPQHICEAEELVSHQGLLLRMCPDFSKSSAHLDGESEGTCASSLDADGYMKIRWFEDLASEILKQTLVKAPMLSLRNLWPAAGNLQWKDILHAGASQLAPG